MNNKNINFQKGNGLIPVIIQEEQTKDILMLGYMNEEALKKTQATGAVHFYSRSKQRLWMKGESSGNTLIVKTIRKDCDNDTLLIFVHLNGTAACHTGNRTCFFTDISKEGL